MKVSILCAFLVLVVPALHAQAPSTPDNASSPAATPQPAPAAPEPSPLATAPVEPPSLIPPNILPAPGALPQMPAAPELEQLNAFFKQTSLGKKADEQRLHLQMAKLETQIRNDDDLHALKAVAQQAPTDLERRHRLKAYYDLYYSKLRALATTPDLRDYLQAEKASHELSLLQPRVRHETDETAAAALAAEAAKASGSAPKALPTPVQARASDALRP